MIKSEKINKQSYLLALSILIRISSSSLGSGTIGFVGSLGSLHVDTEDVEDSVVVDVDEADGELGGLFIIVVAIVDSTSLTISVVSNAFTVSFSVSVVVGISFIFLNSR